MLTATSSAAFATPASLQPRRELRLALAQVLGEVIQHLRPVVPRGLAPALRRMRRLDRVADVLAVAKTRQADDAPLMRVTA